MIKRWALASVAMFVAAAAPPPPKAQTPAEIVAAAPPSAWKSIPAEDLLIIELAGARRIVIQLAPDVAPVHVANIRTLARSGWWTGAAVQRVQDNYVAQWGVVEEGRPLPAGVVETPPHEYWRSLRGLSLRPLGSPDPYAPQVGYWKGWPVAANPRQGWAVLPHCYGYVGVGRGMSPDTGSGSELYAVIGHATRQLDRNIAVVGRVVEGIEHLSSLPRGTEALGFYKDPSQHVPIKAVILASALSPGLRPAFQYMDTGHQSFGNYLRVRANRNDEFYRTAAGGVDLCNAPVPVRKAP